MQSRVEAKIKGISLRHRNKFIEERFGKEGHRKVISILSPDDAKALVDASAFEWYPLRTTLRIDQAIADAFYRGKIECAQEIGTFNLEQSIGKVYRFLFVIFFEPNKMAQQVKRVWPKLVNQGRMESEKRGAKEIALHIYDFYPIKKICCEFTKGGCIGTAKVCGAKNIRVEETECVLSGSSRCSFVIKWD